MTISQQRNKEGIKMKWCNWFHNYIRFPNDEDTALVCPKCEIEHPYNELQLAHKGQSQLQELEKEI